VQATPVTTPINEEPLRLSKGALYILAASTAG